MAKIKANLRASLLRGETTTTQWGQVTFDSEGLAVLEVDEEDLPLLRNLKWLHEPPAAAEAPPEGAGEDGGKTEGDDAGKTEETGKVEDKKTGKTKDRK